MTGWGAVPGNPLSPAHPIPSHAACSLFLLSPLSCNTSCPSGFHGNNCSIPCECPEGSCHPVSGVCHLGKVERRVRGAVTRGRRALYTALGTYLLPGRLGSLQRCSLYPKSARMVGRPLKIGRSPCPPRRRARVHEQAGLDTGMCVRRDSWEPELVEQAMDHEEQTG